MTHSDFRKKKHKGLLKNVEIFPSNDAFTGLPSRRKFIGTAMAGGLSLYVANAFGTMKILSHQDLENNAVADRPFEISLTINPTRGNLPILNWAEEGNWCGRISTIPNTSDEMLEEIKKRGWPATITMWAHPSTRRRQFERWNQPIPDVNEVMARFKRVFGDNFAWEIFTEDDSAGVAYPYTLLREKPGTYEEAKILFDNYLAEAMDVAKPHSDVEQWGRSGYASGAHAFASQGINLLLIERANDDIEDLQTAIAFARGASRQYGCKWGIDFSLWWGVINGCVEKLPTLFHKRNFYLTYYSGADNITVEGGDLLYDLSNNKPNLLGTALAEFGIFTRKEKRGEVKIPVVVVLPEGHGWMTPSYWQTTREAWNYAHIPYRQGYRGVDAFFSMAFPGSNFAMDPFPFGSYKSNNPPASPFAMSCITPEFAPEQKDIYYAEPPLPFGRFENRDKAREDMVKNQTETSPYRPMGTTRWGDVIDVLISTASERVLNYYKVVVLLGPVKMDKPMKERLEAYVKAGGKLLMSAGVAGPYDNDLCGVEIQPELWAGTAWQWKDEPFKGEPFRYCPSKVTPGVNVQILAQTNSGSPLITCYRNGKGVVYTCLVPWFEGVTTLMGAAERMFDEVIGSLQEISIEGLPIHWTSSQREGEMIVTLSNSSTTEWTGCIKVPGDGLGTSKCKELLTGKTFAVQSKGKLLTCEVVVPPYDVMVISIC